MLGERQLYKLRPNNTPHGGRARKQRAVHRSVGARRWAWTLGVKPARTQRQH